MSSSKLLSVILLTYHSGDKINSVYKKLSPVLEKEGIPFELLVVDDGSKDNSYSIAVDLAEQQSNVLAYQLSRNYTSNYSFFAGLSLSNGACAVAIPDDEQQPYETIVEMYRLWENGEKVIIPRRISRDEGIFKKMFSGAFYKIMNLIADIKYPVGGADTVFLDREVLDIINDRIKPINTAVITEVLRLGFDPYFLPFERPRGNQKKSRWTFKKRLKLANDIFFSSSSFPIKMITFFGLFFSFTSFLLIIYYVYVKVYGNKEFWGEILPGWTSTILFIVFFSGLILLSLGIIAQYVWMIFDEVKNRPGYIIKDKNSRKER